jgi:hypothetical protein
VLHEVVEREPVEREREQGGVADEVAEAGAGDAGRPLHLEAAEAGRLDRVGQVGWLAPAGDLDGVVLRVAVGRRVARRVRDLEQQLVPLDLRGRQLLLGGAELLLHALQLGHLLGRRLALRLRAAAELVHLRHERAPALVGCQQGVERLGRALARERGAEAVRVVARRPQVDHGRESR